MRDEDIASDVAALIATEIHSVLELESLLLLYGNPEKEWTADDIGRELRINIDWAGRELERLKSRGFAVAVAADPVRYHYAQAGPSHNAVGGLARAYSERRVSVIERIYSKPPDPLQSFADAFRLRKERRDG